LTLSTSKKRILIIDDDLHVLFVWRAALTHLPHPCVVDTAPDGCQALEKLRSMALVGSEGYDLIITDLIMPELDGWEVLKMATQSQPQPRVIIITAKGTEDTGRTAKEKGAWAYVEKPYIIDKIKEILRSPVF